MNKAFSFILFCFYITTILVPATIFADTEVNIKTGYYVGTGATQTISGLGFQPQLVLIKSDTAVGTLVFKTSAMPAPNTALVTAAADTTTSDITLTTSGFTVGTAAAVNSANVRYTYQAFGGSDCTVSGQFCTGYYLGDGTSTQKIVTGFAPNVVWVKRSGSSANWRSSSMPTNHAQFFDGTVGNTTGALLSTLDSDGFNVGLTNNANLGVYYYTALKHNATKIASGTYAGNATDNRSISGVGFQPSVVYAKSATTTAPAVFNTTESYGDYSHYGTAAANAANDIQVLQSDGFQIGSSANVNTNAVNYYWMAFTGNASSIGSGDFLIRNGSYTGTGAGFSISSLPFRPNLVIIKHNDQATDQYAVFKTSTMAANNSAYLANPIANIVNGITTLNTNGFTIGNNAAVNTNGDTYY